MTTLPMAAFHNYAFASEDKGTATIAADVWAFCLNALGGTPQRTGQPRGRRARTATQRS